MQCDRCRHDAVMYQRYSGLHLCNRHFLADFEAKAKRAIRVHRWMQTGDTIAVALSGEAESSALLWFLSKLTHRRRDVTVSAIVIDEGIAGCRDPERARAVAQSLGISCTTASFWEECGITTDILLQKKGDSISRTWSRVLCDVLLNKTAERQGATRLALCSSLDDEARSVLATVLSGNADRLLCPQPEGSGTVPRITPFMNIPRREVGLYARLSFGSVDAGTCPRPVTSLQEDAGEFIHEFSHRHPSACHALLNLREQLRGMVSPDQASCRVCERCGMVDGPGGCPGCRILDEVRCHAQ